MGYSTRNYMTQDGEELHIGGKLVIEGGGSVEGLPSCAFQGESGATTVAALKEDFNALLEKLKACGLMEDGSK